jgi:hypothetical protein
MDAVITCSCLHIIGDHDAFGCQTNTCRCRLNRDRVIDEVIENLRPKKLAHPYPRPLFSEDAGRKSIDA